jgi:hypothetical protein
MPNLISQNKVALKVGDLVTVNLVVLERHVLMPAVEVGREAQPIDGALAMSPWRRAVRFAVPIQDCLPPKLQAELYDDDTPTR